MFDVTSDRAHHAVDSYSDYVFSRADLGQPSPMPSPNAVNKSSAKKTAERNGVDLGQKLAKRRSQDFATKIEGWNVTGAGVAQQQDEIVVVEEGERYARRAGDDVVEVIVDVMQDGKTKECASPTRPKTPGLKAGQQAPGAKKTQREVDLQKQAWVRRKSKPQVEIAEELKEATTPKKRVVSDGHWRRDRALPSPEKEKEERDVTPKPVTPKPITIRRSVASVGLKVPPSIQDWVHEVEIEPTPNKVKPLRPSDSPERTPDYEDSGVKVYIKRRRKSPSSSDQKDARTSGNSLTAGSSTDITTPSHSPTKELHPNSATEPRTRSPRYSSAAEEALRRRRKSRTPVRDDPERPKTANKADNPVLRPTPPAPPKPQGTRIEGWLADTSDPFLESRDDALTPEPLDLSRKKSRPLDSQSREDEHDLRKSSGRRRRTPPTLEPIATGRGREDFDSTPSHTPTLRRTGARRATQSPVKDRTERGATPESHEKKSARKSPDETRRRTSRREASQPFHTRDQRKLSEASDQGTIIQGSIISRASDGDEPQRKPSGLKRRTTKHSDLMSVLSLPRADNPGLNPARSIRTRRAHPGSATIGDLMNELTTDELKYQRELRTLVDGVIPVLLSYVLQKTDATGSKRLFRGSSPDGQAITRPIVEMGVALERLKATHKRIPLHEPAELVRWAEAASKAYGGYLKAWRLGFQDVVVNLAPAEGNEDPSGEGGLTNGDGERVDVAYLLKRPLVRLKYLAKTFKSIGQVAPATAANSMAAKYHELVEEARRRASEERARLEDETASSIDPTRARDPRTLAPLGGVNIDPTRSVRARDYFDVDLVHSSGQQLTCKTEIILRDDASDRGTSGDILFCEVSTAGRWLLFPPVLADCVSARSGDRPDEIVVMIRGSLASGREWRELISLQSEDGGAVAEWLGMLSSSPAPPGMMKKSSFNELRAGYVSGGLAKSAQRAPPISEVDIPIGVRASSQAQRWDGSDVNSVVGDLPGPSLRRAKAKRYRSTPSSPVREDSYEKAHARASYLAEQEHYDDKGSRSRNHGRPASSYTATTDWTGSSSNVSTPKKEYSVWLPQTDDGSSDKDSEPDDRRPDHRARPGMRRRTSSVPSLEMPTINKLRKSQQSTPRQPSDQRTPEGARATEDPASAPGKLQKRRPTPSKDDLKKKADPSPAGQTRVGSLGLRSSILPSFTPAFLKRHRRSSSPLKHEYEPSTASESLSDSEPSDLDDAESITSESSAEEGAISTIGELRDFKFGPIRQPPTPKSIFSGRSDTLGPSESASQGPYRSVPPSVGQPVKTVASIFAWSDRGAWDPLHPEECTIVVTPGLVEAFDITQANAASSKTTDGKFVSPSQHGVRPLIALELTPLVPLRRGTALDISIRSPPTTNSVIRAGNNVMLRSRTPEDCERLYALINRARIDNPTYIALQNARSPMQQSNWGEVMDKRNAARTTSGPWWRGGSRKSSTYRSNGSRPASAAATDSSINTMNTAFSALRRFSGNSSSRIFNIAKSSLTTREGTRSTYSDSLSSGAATPIAIDPSLGTPLGITNAKIRLYVRETASKWRDMGSARLTVMLPPRPDPSVPANPRTIGLEKRIIICGKISGETMLDVTLGESAFERVARTGIAVSVWEDGDIGAVGGVASARSRVYMVQMKSERDAAYTFGLCGKLRY